jgi:hypothetical protein
LGATNILNTTATEYGWPCPSLESPPPEPDSCAFKADSFVAEEVTIAMVSKLKFKGRSWPNVVGFLDEFYDRDSIYGGTMTVAPRITVFAVIFGLGLIVRTT